MQRVRIGLTGLAGVFVLVLFAAAFFGMVSDEPVVTTDDTGNVIIIGDGSGNSTVVDAPPKEPLAELGVAPGASSDEAANNSITAPPPAR